MKCTKTYKACVEQINGYYNNSESFEKMHRLFGDFVFVLLLCRGQTSCQMRLLNDETLFVRQKMLEENVWSFTVGLKQTTSQLNSGIYVTAAFSYLLLRLFLFRRIPIVFLIYRLQEMLRESVPVCNILPLELCSDGSERQATKTGFDRYACKMIFILRAQSEAFDAKVIFVFPCHTIAF